MGLEFKNKGPWETQPIFMGRAGSAAYATMTPESDTDYRGVFFAEPKHLIGLSNIESYTEEQPIDLQCYELRHFVRLCLRGSPLQLEMLFYPEDVIEFAAPEWYDLLKIRKAFLAKSLKATLGGFARGDIQRISGNLTQKCGAKGKLLIERFGYNTKHASNAYRLLKMSELLWTTGELAVRLPEENRKEIIAIKKGKYTREEFLNYVKDEDKRVFELADKSALPASPNHELAEQTVMDIYRKKLFNGLHT